MSGATFLSVEGLTKCYGNVPVLRDVSIEFAAGQIHALLGANGAGKSTLCKIISGLTPASDGCMTLGDTSYQPASKQDAEAHGVQIVHQELNLIETLSVAENLRLTRLPHQWGVLRVAELHRDARTILDRFGLNDVDTKTLVGDLGVGKQQMLEIAAALARDARVLILDEPTAALSGTESEELFRHLRGLRDQGVANIYISHRLEEVQQLSDRISVLRDGRLVTTTPTIEVDREKMVAWMSSGAQEADEKKLGQSNDSPIFNSHRTEQTGLRVQNLSCGMVRDVSLNVRRGERLGIAGLVGAGRTEFLRAVFGADVAESGTVAIGDSPARRFRHPSEAVSAGFAMVTEDRKQNGLLLSQSILANTSLAALATKYSSRGWIDQTREKQDAMQIHRSLETRSQSLSQTVGTLSGGNQQKVAVAKWLTRGADVFLFDEPSRGIDVAARSKMYELFERLAEEGKTIVIVSSDLEELFETCDAIAVMSSGRLVQTFQRSEFDEEAILQASFGQRSKAEAAQ
ncbi:sugar ABC transporter ATP-binding protein [Rhodopirellula sp. JC740]|uniref:Sugar ABC transporter ATP-binding protein n=1 Tax=Rhodopirellula halodulae TaxID=2894198 RepID=A0ABS8NM31_9BACT|nr:sugar ABC transporter ATP-binding protein [Rhodopirellula sp. JC740]MCC9644641.1 sugar ABC transporter ATP-binding protein [Rhodopirellula sp. JC740]